MPKNSPIPVPDSGAALQWLMQHPDAAVAAVQALNLILALQAKFTKAGLATFNQQQSLMISDEAIILNLPLFWPNGVPAAPPAYSDTADGSYNAGQMEDLITQVEHLTEVVTKMIAGESAVQDLPGAPT